MVSANSRLDVMSDDFVNWGAEYLLFVGDCFDAVVELSGEFDAATSTSPDASR
jgi:hypothetical protein